MQYIKKLPANAVKIPNTKNWIDDEGNLYGIETRIIKNVKHSHYGEYFKNNVFVNNKNGYVYGSIKYILKDGKYQNRQRRIHILVAQAFLDNPNNYPIVGHKNNIKTDNRAENLYWTTPSENTQKAFDDGLLVNAKGYEDSQSQPVYMFDTYTNKLLGDYGSISEASRETGITKNTIARQAKYKKPVRKPFYFRFQDDKSAEIPKIVIEYDYFTDEEIGRYWNVFDASRKTGIHSNTISQQCNNGWKPKTRTKSGKYFLFSK